MEKAKSDIARPDPLATMMLWQQCLQGWHGKGCILEII
jgi:hypothetical protein